MSNTFPATDAPGLLREGCAALLDGVPCVIAGRITSLKWTAGTREGFVLIGEVAAFTIDCDRPAARDVTVRWFSEQGLDYAWARDIPGALVEGVRRAAEGPDAAGYHPLIGAKSGPLVWTEVDEQGWSFLDDAAGSACAHVNEAGWKAYLDTLIRGPETGEEGKRLAEAAVRARYWVTEPARCLKSIHHTHHGEVLASTLCVRVQGHEGDCLDALAAP